jgi:hypothetical protein
MPGCLSLEPCLTSWTGTEYHRNSRQHLPEQQVQFLVPAEYLLGLVTGDYLDYQYSRLLVHPEILEDQHEEDGV